MINDKIPQELLCKHNWDWINIPSISVWAGYWRCKKCGIVKYSYQWQPKEIEEIKVVE